MKGRDVYGNCSYEYAVHYSFRNAKNLNQVARLQFYNYIQKSNFGHKSKILKYDTCGTKIKSF